MEKNLNLTNGLIFSQRVMLELTKYGFSREDAYNIVQKNAKNSWNKNIPFYKKCFDQHEFNPYVFSNQSQLEVLPILTKDIINDNIYFFENNFYQ